MTKEQNAAGRLQDDGKGAPDAPAPAPSPSEKRGEVQRTHYDGCWRDPRHHACAVAKIEELQSARLGSMAIYDPATGKCRGECDCSIGQTCKAYLVYRGRLDRSSHD